MTPLMIIQLIGIAFILYLPTLLISLYYTLKLRNMNQVANIQYELLKQIKSDDQIYFRSVINKQKDFEKKVLTTLFYPEIEHEADPE